MTDDTDDTWAPCADCGIEVSTRCASCGRPVCSLDGYEDGDGDDMALICEDCYQP